MKKELFEKPQNISRRNFIKTSAGAGLAAMLAGKERIFAAGTNELKIGLIGCGFRGTGAAAQILTCSSQPVKLWAMGDMFPDQIKSSIQLLTTGGERKYDRESFPSLADKLDVPPERQFTGFDAYKNVINSGVDVVLLTTPPHFRPIHLEAAVEANKHVFMEKPVAVDPVGVRSVISSSELAKTKGLCLVAGTQRRYAPSYIETMKRIHQGDIGEVAAAQVYFMTQSSRNGGYFHERQPGWSDMEWQIRNWIYFTWLSGDHIVEQHVHSIDVMNWAFGTHPVKVLGMGGRQVLEAGLGDIYDHFAVEYEFPNGARAIGMCRQIDKCSGRTSERFVGTKGVATEGLIEGQKPFKYEKPATAINPYVQEHAELIASIIKGKPINDGIQVAETTLTAILGRISAYTGREISWDWAMKYSKLDLTPPKYELGSIPVGPVAMPGVVQLI